jgi:Uma2 family endonuclease
MMCAMAETKTLMTADQLAALPEDGCLHELVRGALLKMAPAADDHSRREVRGVVRIANFVYANRLGEVYGGDAGFLLERSPDTVRSPDIAFVQRERLRPIDQATGYIPGAPDLAVEIVSPSNSAQEIDERVADLLRTGCRLVWVYYPRRGALRVFRADATSVELGPDDTISAEEVLPGFAMKVADLFATS